MQTLKRFLLWFPDYWVLRTIGELAGVLGLTLGAVVGAFLFQLIYPLPPKTWWQAAVFLGLAGGLGFYGMTELSDSWKQTIRGITQRMARDLGAQR